MRRVLLAVAAALAVAAILLAVSGGVRANVGGFRFSARSPVPAMALSLLSLGAWALLARRGGAIGRDLQAVWSFLEQRASMLVIAIAVSGGAVAIVFATWSASGADASGYLSEAAQWATGHTLRVDRLSTELNVAFERGVTSPLGWRPGTVRGWQAPTYPPGLPLVMAGPYLVAGSAGACLVVAASASVAVWAAGALAIEMAGGIAGVLAAIALATTPVFLYQSIQPMSDVPVTAFWMVCWWLIARGGGKPSGLPAGIACAIAILIRPNLAPLALIPFLATRGSRVKFAIPVAMAGLTLAVLQWHWYGSPLRTGYGTAEELFAFHNIPANASHYFGWLVETSPLLLLAGFGWWLTRRRPLAASMAVFVVAVVAAYLGYAVFTDWSYLRFLLPALGLGAVFVGALGAAGLAELPAAARAPLLTAAALAMFSFGIVEARDRDAFRLAGQQNRIAQLAGTLSSKLAGSDVIVSGEQSGSMRFYTGHDVVRWDAIQGEEWPAIVATLGGQGHGVWIVLDAFEEPLFRSRLAALDWPPAIDAGDTHRTRAWRLTDRARFAAGEQVATERIR